MIDIYIGYDPREAIAYHVCQNSIIEHCSQPNWLSFHPIRGERRDGSNDFIYARFLVPYYQRFSGFALFLDGDMIVRDDILDLWNQRDPYKAVQVVKHDYQTKFPKKYLGNENVTYPRKNWSSVILWNCFHYHNRQLTPEFVEDKPGSFLHRFSWLEDNVIGELDSSWNRLVLEQPVYPGDKLLHYTVGTPCFAEYSQCEHSDEWHEAKRKTVSPL